MNKKNSDAYIKEILQKSAAFTDEDIVIPKDPSLRDELTRTLWKYFKYSLAQKRRNKFILSLVVFCFAVIILIFVSVTVFSSIDDIKSGQFNFFKSAGSFFNNLSF